MGLVCLASLRSVWLPGSFLLLPVSVLRFFFLLKIYLLIFYWVFILCFIYLFLPMLGLRRCVWAFFSCGEREPPSSWGARASPCGGFSGCGARALGTRAQQLRLPGSRHMGFSGCGSQAPGRGLSGCGSQAPGTRASAAAAPRLQGAGSVVACTGFVSLLHVGPSWTKD